ncbi:MAG: phosphoribosyltransferase family protein [Pseudomonadota bacterium]
MSRDAILIEDKSLNGKTGVFRDRIEAGDLLANLLGIYEDSSALVLAIPSGGVPVGLTMSRNLNLPFDLIPVRKIPIPGNTEAGFGALTLEGDRFLNKSLVSQLGLTDEEIEELSLPVREELTRRNRVFRQDRPFPNMHDRRVIVVDDGLASGYTMLATVHMVKRRGASYIVVAVPTAPMGSIRRIAPSVDEIYCLNVRETPFFAVADAYRLWYDLTEEDVISLL